MGAAVVTANPVTKYPRDHVACECGKKQYRTKAKARDAARQFALRLGEDIGHYKCPFDRRLWHIGHPPNRPQADRTRTDERERVRRRAAGIPPPPRPRGTF